VESGLLDISERIDFSAVFEQIKSGRRIGIQLPDGLKFYAGEIARKFREKGFEVLISGKASYGACDIDMELLNAVDFLVHFGHTKMVDVERVIYAPYRVNYSIDVWLLKEKIKEREIAVIGTASYAWKFEEVAEELENAGFQVELKKGRGLELKGQVLGCNYSALEDVRSSAILFIGDGLFHPRGAKLYCNKRVYAYSPLTGEIFEVDESEFVRRRYIEISRAKTAKSFGILVSTKIGQKRLDMALKIQREAFERGLVAEIILLDEINPSALDNFRFDAFVNTACPRISYDDYGRFSKPIITPREFEMMVRDSKALSLESFF